MREWRKEWRVKRNESKGEEVAGQASYIEGEGVGYLLIDWVGWEVASSLIGLVGRLACGRRI